MPNKSSQTSSKSKSSKQSKKGSEGKLVKDKKRPVAQRVILELIHPYIDYGVPLGPDIELYLLGILPSELTRGEVIMDDNYGVPFFVREIKFKNRHLGTSCTFNRFTTELVVEDFSQAAYAPPHTPPVKPVIKPVARSGLGLEDIIGQEDGKRTAKLILKYFSDAETFGEFPPHMNLFHGPPGTGKTYTAKVISSMADVPFYSCKANEFIGRFVGMSSANIKSRFEAVIQNAPAVMFIDEIDAIGLNRDYSGVRGDVSETVNALLTYIDDFSESKDLVLICASNNINLLDSALMSRLKNKTEFKKFSKEERVQFLEKYLKGVKLVVDVDCDNVANGMRDYSARQMLGDIERAYHNAILENSKNLTTNHFTQLLQDATKRDASYS